MREVSDFSATASGKRALMSVMSSSPKLTSPKSHPRRRDRRPRPRPARSGEQNAALSVSPVMLPLDDRRIVVLHVADRDPIL